MNIPEFPSPTPGANEHRMKQKMLPSARYPVCSACRVTLSKGFCLNRMCVEFKGGKHAAK